MSKHKPKRQFESIDPRPHVLPVNFTRPPTLQELVRDQLAANERLAKAHGQDESDSEGWDNPEYADLPETPHELVHDELLNKDMPRHEKILLDHGRNVFEKKLQERIKRDRERSRIAKSAIDTWQQEQKKKSAKKADKNSEETE